MKKILGLIAGLALSTLSVSANAAAIVDMHASSVIDYSPVGAISPSRSDPTKALGAPEGDNSFNFVTLGFGGSLTLGFHLPVIASGLLVVETSFGDPSYAQYPESADVFLKLLGEATWTNVGSVTTNGGTIDLIAAFGAGQLFEPMMKIVDTTTPGGPSADGFDVDGVTVKGYDVPAPGVVALMGLGLIGLGVARRRRHA